MGTKAENYVDAKAIMAHLSISKSTMYGMIARQEIPFYRVGRAIRFKIEEVDNYMQQCKVQPISLY